MKKQKPKPALRWPYVMALVLLFGISIALRAAQVVGPKPELFTLADDDSKLAYAMVQKNITKTPTTNEEMPRPAKGTVNVPILMYHRTPADFEAQIKHLDDRGYTSITPGDLWSALSKSTPLPAKPVIITLDDGYTDQLRGITILRKYNMKATLYVINGGPTSKWCIGANAKKLPGCEPYLNWEQIKTLDQEGLITIGSHTINHPDLPLLTAEQQRTEILGGKQQLEARLGHKVYDLAYPYGRFNESSILLAKQAGFRTAVTTEPGSTHAVGTLFTLTRLRDSLLLP